MRKKGVIPIVSPAQGNPGFVSLLILVPNKGGCQRPVVNLRPVNHFLPYEHFKMEGIHIAKDLLVLRKGLVLWSRHISRTHIFHVSPLPRRSEIYKILQDCLPPTWPF